MQGGVGGAAAGFLPVVGDAGKVKLRSILLGAEVEVQEAIVDFCLLCRGLHHLPTYTTHHVREVKNKSK